MQLFEVGGCVRDEILGGKSKDIDFTVVLDDADLRQMRNGTGLPDTDTPFGIMRWNLQRRGFRIFKEDPQFLTIRAQFPKGDERVQIISKEVLPYIGKGLTTDFVLARKESDYTDGRRPDKVIPGTLEDDLARRDFTMNAIAKAADGSLIDPFNGQADIRRRVIKAVGDPVERLSEDALRAVRAIRFAVTKGFTIEPELAKALESAEVLNAIADNISDERIQQELSKMFRYDTYNAVMICNEFPYLASAMFAGSVSLDATMKLKGRK